MRLRAALLAAGTTALLAGGCHPRLPPADLSAEGGTLLAQVRATQAAAQRVQGEARLRIRTPRGTVAVRQFTAAERPDRLHLEELDFFGNPAAVLVTSGGRFALYNAKEKVVYRGAATPANLSRLVPLPLSAEDLVAILLGSAPVLPGRPLGVAAEGERLRLRLQAGDTVQDLWIGAHAVVERAVQAVAGGAGPGSWELELKAHEERAGAWFPGLLALRSDPAHVQLDLAWTQVEVNAALDEALFELRTPRGVREVDLGEGEVGPLIGPGG